MNEDGRNGMSPAPPLQQLDPAAIDVCVHRVCGHTTLALMNADQRSDHQLKIITAQWILKNNTEFFCTRSAAGQG